MARNSSRAGGGINSNKVVHRNAPKAEPRARAVNPGGVGQLGSAQGSHVTNKGGTGYRGEKLIAGAGYSPPVGPTNNVSAVGVGGGRTVMRSGGQATHGNVVPGLPKITNTKGEWPDKRGS